MSVFTNYLVSLSSYLLISLLKFLDLFFKILFRNFRVVLLFNYQDSIFAHLFFYIEETRSELSFLCADLLCVSEIYTITLSTVCQQLFLFSFSLFFFMVKLSLSSRLSPRKRAKKYTVDRTNCVNGEGGIRTHAPLRTNGFQDRLVMTTSIPLHILFSTQHFVALICAPLADCFASIAF